MYKQQSYVFTLTQRVQLEYRTLEPFEWIIKILQ